MMADDIRGSLRPQNNNDAAVLEQFLTSNAARAAQSQGGRQGGGGGQGSGGQGNGGQGNSGQGGGGQAVADKVVVDKLVADKEMERRGQVAGVVSQVSPWPPRQAVPRIQRVIMDPTAATDAGTTGTAPPGIFGTETAIEIDVSRPPRPDEYLGEIANPLEARLTDIPSDTKKISYYIQAAQLQGIQDPLEAAAGNGNLANGGLVRRSLDRAVTRWVYEQGQMEQMASTGQLIAPEVVALSFTYFDGLQWTPTWDSSAQGLPGRFKSPSRCNTAVTRARHRWSTVSASRLWPPFPNRRQVWKPTACWPSFQEPNSFERLPNRRPPTARPLLPLAVSDTDHEVVDEFQEFEATIHVDAAPGVPAAFGVAGCQRCLANRGISVGIDVDRF